MCGRLALGQRLDFDFFFAGKVRSHLPKFHSVAPTRSGSPNDEVERLQILPRPIANSSQGGLQVLQRIGHAEAQVALAEFTEGGAGERGYSCLFQQGILGKT
jgi:hypothetical protein